MTWSDDDITTLKKLWLAGESATFVARQLGGAVTRSAVLGKVNRLGLSRTPGVRSGPAPVSKTVRMKPAPSAFAPPRPEAEAALKAASALPTAVQPKPLLERGPRECCWPVGLPDRERGQLFCCAPTAFRQSYCPDHRPSDGQTLKALRPTGEHRVQRSRRERDEGEVELTELVA